MRGMHHRRTLLLAAVIIPAVVGVWLFTLGPGKRLIGHGRDVVEQWVGSQVQLIANHFLNPEFAFERFRFEYPGTVHLTNVTLIADGEQFVTAESVRIRLSERPGIGRPIVIESVHVKRPLVKLIQDEENRLAGFSNFLATTEGRVFDDGSSTKPSDIFAIRSIVIDEGILEYSVPATGRTMRLDELTFELENSPDARERGWYTLAAVIARTPLFEVDADLRYNIDTRLLEIAEAVLTMDLHQEQYDRLPPQLQAFLSQYEMAGSLRAMLTGTAPIGSIAEEANLVLNAELSDGYIAGEEYQLPLSKLTIDATMSEGVIALSPIRAEALRGVLHLAGTIQSTGARRADLVLNVTDVQIEEILREFRTSVPRYAGRISLESTIRSELNSWREKLGGSGSVAVREGRLINVAIIGGLVSRIGGEGDAQEDRLDAQLALTGEQLRLSEIHLHSSTIVARGDGAFYPDRRIDFRLNAGPLERLQQRLGLIGEVLGGVTDNLVTYHVTGTFDEPKFRVVPLQLDRVLPSAGSGN